jgi:hypothetical protein
MGEDFSMRACSSAYAKLGYHPRLGRRLIRARLHSLVWVQNFGSRRTAMICSSKTSPASSSVPRAGPDSNSPWRKSSVAGHLQPNEALHVVDKFGDPEFDSRTSCETEGRRLTAPHYAVVQRKNKRSASHPGVVPSNRRLSPVTIHCS